MSMVAHGARQYGRTYRCWQSLDRIQSWFNQIHEGKNGYIQSYKIPRIDLWSLAGSYHDGIKDVVGRCSRWYCNDNKWINLHLYWGLLKCFYTNSLSSLPSPWFCTTFRCKFPRIPSNSLPAMFLFHSSYMLRTCFSCSFYVIMFRFSCQYGPVSCLRYFW